MRYLAWLLEGTLQFPTGKDILSIDLDLIFLGPRLDLDAHPSVVLEGLSTGRLVEGVAVCGPSLSLLVDDHDPLVTLIHARHDVVEPGRNLAGDTIRLGPAALFLLDSLPIAPSESMPMKSMSVLNTRSRIMSNASCAFSGRRIRRKSGSSPSLAAHFLSKIGSVARRAASFSSFCTLASVQ